MRMFALVIIDFNFYGLIINLKTKVSFKFLACPESVFLIHSFLVLRFSFCKKKQKLRFTALNFYFNKFYSLKL